MYGWFQVVSFAHCFLNSSIKDLEGGKEIFTTNIPSLSDMKLLCNRHIVPCSAPCVILLGYFFIRTHGRLCFESLLTVPPRAMRQYIPASFMRTEGAFEKRKPNDRANLVG